MTDESQLEMPDYGNNEVQDRAPLEQNNDEESKEVTDKAYEQQNQEENQNDNQEQNGQQKQTNNQNSQENENEDSKQNTKNATNAPVQEKNMNTDQSGKKNAQSKNITQLQSPDSSQLMNESHLTANRSLIGKNFGDRLYRNQSASTLNHSIHSYTIPKEHRMNTEILKVNGNMYTLESSQAKRATSLGKGERSFKHTSSDTSQLPGPSTYEIKSNFDRNKENYGKTFGLSHDAYSKCGVSGVKCTNIPVYESKKIPGPGQYDIQKNASEFGQPKYTINSRGKLFNENLYSIGPGAVYNPNYYLVEQRRYDGVGFGFGNKSSFSTGRIKTLPGPGQYKLPSIFDKYYSK